MSDKMIINQANEKIISAMKALKLSTLNKKVFKIDKWNPTSQLLFDLGLIGIILFILNVFNIIPWVVNWIFALFLIAMLGFIFAKPGKKFNFSIVFFAFIFLALIPSRPVQQLTTIYDPFGNNPFNPENYAPSGSGSEILKNKVNEETEKEYDNYDGSDVYESIEDLKGNPLDDIEGYMINFMDVMNWIVFLGIIGFGATAVGDAIKMDYGAAAKKGAMIAMAIAVLVAVSSVLQAGDIEVRAVWDTVGESWENMLKSIGLASLDQQGNTVANTNTAMNGLLAWIPLILPIAYIGVSISLRKTDFESVMFAKDVTAADSIVVRRTNFSIPILVLLIVLIVYVAGYNLVTAEPTVNINPIITLTFYISSAIILFLIGNRILIINKSLSFSNLTKDLVKFTAVGMMGLFLWFQVFQPSCYQMGWLDQPSGLITMSQETVLQSNVLEQLFLVAMPETLIFQIAPIGIANRAYYSLRRGKLRDKEIQRMNEKIVMLKERKSAIPVKLANEKQLLINLAKIALIEKEIDNLSIKITANEVDKIPFSYFVLPSMLAGLIGSFFFSWYHSFRRGISFIDWWQNPSLGMTYFGAGFFLSLIAMFSAPAAIVVHWLNNLISILMSGG